MKNVLIFGGAGFIGYHSTVNFLRQGFAVTVADNLSRGGARLNLLALQKIASQEHLELTFRHVDIRVQSDVASVMRSSRPSLIIHQAAQVAVTTSVSDPLLDYQTNATGTFHVLEATRTIAPEAFFIFASTNKVYGGLERLTVAESNTRYYLPDYPEGTDEQSPLDFHSPYACSKGAADQYVHDYSRIYGLRTCIFRQSCIYGTHQYGVEDQGWIAWFTIARILEKQATIYGSGKQVRDILWVEDLVAAYSQAYKLNQAGKIYNIGGGSENTLSITELMTLLDSLHPTPRSPTHADPRPGDQPVYISDSRRAKRELQWAPRVSPKLGIEKLHRWISENKGPVEQVLAMG